MNTIDFFDSELSFEKVNAEKLYDCRENCFMALYRDVAFAGAEQWLNELESKKEKNEEYLNTLESQIEAVQVKANTIESQIKVIDSEIAAFNKQIKKLGNEIAETKEEIKENKESIDSAKGELSALLRSSYVNGDRSRLKQAF